MTTYLNSGVRGAALLLGLLFPPLLLFYLIGRSELRDEVAYLRLASSGEIVEEGDTLAAMRRELRRSRRTALVLLGAALALAAGLIGYARWTAATATTDEANLKEQGSDAARSARHMRSASGSSTTRQLTGGNERLPILKAVRASVESRVGQSIKLYDVRLETDGEWAAVSATIKDETGVEVPLPDAATDTGESSSRVIALVQKQAATWRVRGTTAATNDPTDDPTPELMSQVSNAPPSVEWLLEEVTGAGLVP